LKKKKLSGLTDKYWITDFNYLDEVRSQFHLPDRVITQLGVYGFDEETKRLKLISLRPGVSIADVKESSSFEVIIPDKVETSPEPSEEHLRMLREEIDPAGIVLGK